MSENNFFKATNMQQQLPFEEITYPRSEATLNNCGLNATIPTIVVMIAALAKDPAAAGDFIRGYCDLMKSFNDFYKLSPILNAGAFDIKENAKIITKTLAHYNNNFDNQMIFGPVLRKFMACNFDKSQETMDSWLLDYYRDNSPELTKMEQILDDGRYCSLGPEELFNYLTKPLGFSIQYNKENQPLQNLDQIEAPLGEIKIFHSGGAAGAESGGHWELTDDLSRVTSDQSSAQLAGLLRINDRSKAATEQGLQLLQTHVQATLNNSQKQETIITAMKEIDAFIEVSALVNKTLSKEIINSKNDYTQRFIAATDFSALGNEPRFEKMMEDNLSYIKTYWHEKDLTDLDRLKMENVGYESFYAQNLYLLYLNKKQLINAKTRPKTLAEISEAGKQYNKDQNITRLYESYVTLVQDFKFATIESELLAFNPQQLTELCKTIITKDNAVLMQMAGEALLESIKKQDLQNKEIIKQLQDIVKRINEQIEKISVDQHGEHYTNFANFPMLRSLCTTIKEYCASVQSQLQLSQAQSMPLYFQVLPHQQDVQSEQHAQYVHAQHVDESDFYRHGELDEQRQHEMLSNINVEADRQQAQMQQNPLEKGYQLSSDIDDPKLNRIVEEPSKNNQQDIKDNERENKFKELSAQLQQLSLKAIEDNFKKCNDNEEVDIAQAIMKSLIDSAQGTLAEFIDLLDPSSVTEYIEEVSNILTKADQEIASFAEVRRIKIAEESPRLGNFRF